MGLRGRKIGRRGQGTMGGHGKNHGDPERENTEASRRQFKGDSNESRGGKHRQEVSDYIQKRDTSYIPTEDATARTDQIVQLTCHMYKDGIATLLTSDAAQQAPTEDAAARIDQIAQLTFIQGRDSYTSDQRRSIAYGSGEDRSHQNGTATTLTNDATRQVPTEDAVARTEQIAQLTHKDGTATLLTSAIMYKLEDIPFSGVVG